MSRIKPEREIKYICSVIDKNIEANKILNDRGLLAENILSQLRNLVEDVAIFINNQENSLDKDDHYENVEESMKFVSGISKYKYISKFHNLLQGTVSHYTPSEDDAERLILFYYRYICMIKETLEKFGLIVLEKLEDFPIYEDKLTKEHYEKIGMAVNTVTKIENRALRQGRFYINRCRPIYAKGKLFYEYTLTKATDYYNKFERILMYSKLYIPNNYSIKLSYVEKYVEIFSYNSKIKIIDNYVISIRPCELQNIGRIMGLYYNVSDEYSEYQKIMLLLKERKINLLEFINEEKETFKDDILKIRQNNYNNNITNIILELRKIILSGQKGSNVLKYLIINLKNKIIKDQKDKKPNIKFNQMYLKNKTIPFDSMPYAMSLHNHNTSFIHLLEAISIENRECELLGRYVKDNCENNNILYTPSEEVEKFGNIDDLIKEYNDNLIKYGIDIYQNNILVKENKNIYIKSYETTSIEIIKELNTYLVKTDDFIIEDIDRQKEKYINMDLSKDKTEILDKIFRNESIAIIHGPAGTGKTKMLEVLAQIFMEYKKVFLSNTKTSVENLRERIERYDCNNSNFETVAFYNKYDSSDYDILIIDECSTVNNNDMLKIIKNNRFKLIILAGDVFQIESIKYGNWFSIAYHLFNNKCVYELINTKRTEDKDLIELWKMVRDNNEKAINKISNKEYSSTIENFKIFERTDEDEIILCLNYDGLYGINNINKILQDKNDNKEYNIGIDRFKIEDPIVFNDCPRFSSLYNNLKGIIKNIVIDNVNECTWFTILVYDTLFNSFDDYEIIETQGDKTVIKFYVRNFKDTNEEENGYDHIIPFNLAYAVSIHKAQGLEYNSVKIIITSNIEDEITKNIFYTAITRTKKYLKIFWSSESEDKIFEKMKEKENHRDAAILKQKINLLKEA